MIMFGKTHDVFRSMYMLMILVFISAGVSAYGYADTTDETTLTGSLYVGGQIFGKIDLESKKWEAVYVGQDSIYCDFPNVVSKNVFILETKGNQIEYFDTLSHEFTYITKGLKPLYVSEINSIFYYKYNEGLFQKVLDANIEDRFITNNIHIVAPPIQPNVLYYPDPPIKISSQEIAYYNRSAQIEIYNHITKTFRQLSVVGYKPRVFYNAKNALVCVNNTDGSIYFIDVVNSTKQKIPIRNSNHIRSGIIVVDNHGCLIYSKFRGGPFFWESEYKDTYVYWVSKQKEEEYIKNDDISSGAYVKG